MQAAVWGISALFCGGGRSGGTFALSVTRRAAIEMRLRVLLILRSMYRILQHKRFLPIRQITLYRHIQRMILLAALLVQCRVGVVFADDIPLFLSLDSQVN